MIGKYELFSSCISSLYHDVQKIERVEMAKYGLKGPHAQMLVALSRHEQGITAAQLCEACEKDKAAISRTVAELEQAGLLVRKEKNGVRYRSLLCLTEDGRKVAKDVNSRVELAVELAGKGLEDDHRQIFYQVLALISGNLHNICKDGLKEKE